MQDVKWRYDLLDALLAGLVLFAAYRLLLRFAGGEAVFVWLHEHAGIGYDEWILLALVVPGIVLFAVLRRLVRMQRAMRHSAEAEARARQLAVRDPLTDLPNRGACWSFVRSALAEAAKTDAQVALLHIDLDYFKRINDTLGHHVGDALLRWTAQVLRQSIRAQDLAGRVGGDEFVVVLCDTSAAEAREAGERLLGRLRQPARIGDLLTPCGASIGVAIFPGDAGTAEDLFLTADLALYDAKRAGRDMLRLFGEELRTRYDERRMLEAELSRAIARDEFIIVFQPQLSTTSGVLQGLEALIRWDHPLRGLLPPSAFLDVAAASGQLIDIGNRVVDLVLGAIARWKQQGLDFGAVGINASLIELRQSEFARRWIDRMAHFGVAPRDVKIEVIESVFFDRDSDTAIANIEALVRHGVEIELDDFGTGYASLSTLHSGSVNRIKIDRHFVCDLERKPEARQLVATLIEMARSLGLEVVAEGVETQGQRAILVELGCHTLQGFGIAPPMDEETLAWWLREQGAAGERETGQGHKLRVISGT